MSEYRNPLSPAGKSWQEREAEKVYQDIAQQATRQQQREAVTRISDNPDQAGEARRVARQVGVPAPLVQARLPDYKADQRRSQVAEAARDPRVGPWVAQNADVASDDIANLINLGQTGSKFKVDIRPQFSRREVVDDNFRPATLTADERKALRQRAGNREEYRALVADAVLTRRAPQMAADMAAQEDQQDKEERMRRGAFGQVSGSLGAGVFNFAGGMYGLGANIAAVAGFDDTERALLGVQGLATAKADGMRGRSTSFVTDSLLTGVESIPVSVGTLLTGSGKMALGLFFSQTAGNSYAEARNAGKGVGLSTSYAASQGSIEVITERLPTGELFKIADGGGSISRGIKRFLIGEALGEQAATFFQDMNTWATLNPEKSVSEFISERPEAAARTFFATMSGSGPQALMAYGLQRSARLQNQIDGSEQNLSALDEMMRSAAESKTRTRDPEAFRDLINQVAGNDKRLFVSGEVIAQFNQSYRDDEFWRDYADEIDEAVATGGDVSLPLADVAARLAGKPDWDAIGPEARLGAVGMSRTEIDEFNRNIETDRAEAEDEVDRMDRLSRAKEAPGVKLRESIRGQLMNAGQTPDVAAANAEVAAALFETEAANLGRTITGDEFSSAIAVQRELPGLIGASQPADQLDIVVNAMRSGGEVNVGVGPSLLQFIGQQGGINDSGGDFASMGLPKRLIRDFDPRQGTMGLSGAGANGVDSIFQRAIEDGYFPDLVGVADQSGPSTLDTNVFMEAVGRELAGEKLFSSTREEVYRRAGEELRAILEEAGINPDTASMEEVRAAVSLFGEGRSFDQASLPETIDIDGVARPTTNSEGQPLARDEAGVRAFWAWFGDSKVVDAEGRPLVVYHGTPDARELNADGQFRTSDERAVNIGILSGDWTKKAREQAAYFFTPDKRAASSYTDSFRAYDRENAEPALVPVYLALHEPAELDFGGERWTGTDAAIAQAKTAGQDGVIIQNVRDHYMSGKVRKGDKPHMTAVAFNPEQIKSVNNRGTFDPADPRILFQNETVPQGQIQFTDAIAIIKLFETADLTTFQHEMAHFWLERFKGNALASIETDGNPAARSTFADWETLKAWFAENGAPVAEDGTIPTEAHELFARSWERYLMEGKSPKTSLNSTFRKVAQWFRSIYRSIKALNAPITPEVREVMDRMLATEDEIAAAGQDRAMMLMFDDAVAAGMTEAQAARYKALGDEARSEAEEELYGKVMRAIRARETKAWKEQERFVRSDIRDMVDNRPVFQALAMLRGDYRLNRKWLVDTYGEDALKMLPAGVPPIYREGGENADQIAEMVGFRSGDEMVRELMGLESLRQQMKASGDKRSVKKATIDQEVTLEMNRRFGDILSDGSIEREAAAAIQNERQGERLEMELRALASKAGKRPTPYALAREWAKAKVARGVVAETVSGEAQYRYTRTASKAARAATSAFAKGDSAEAFKQKQIEMLHNALAREAAEMGDRVDSAVKRMGKLAKQRTVKTLAQDYLEQIHGLLEGYEFKRVTQRQINARDSYAKWANEQTAAGHDVVAVDRLAQSKNWSRLTVEEILALDDAVKGLVHLGKLKRTLLDNKARRDLDEVVGEAIMSAARLPQKDRKSLTGGEGWLDGIKGKFLSLNAALRKMEDVFDRLDGFKTRSKATNIGVFNRVVIRPIYEAQENERAMLDDVVGQAIEAMKAVPKESLKRWQEKRTIDELQDMDTLGRPLPRPATMLGEELVVMAMNMGNRGNMEKLIAGRGWDKQYGSIDAAKTVVLDVLNRELTVEDWRYVERVWEIVDSLWPQLSEVEKRVNGFAPDKVEAVPLTTSAGVLRGGYFPVVYDPTTKVGQRNLEVEEKGLFPSSYYRATTRAGSTRERTEFKGPLHLSLGVINRHLAEVVHDITHREAIMNADKFLSDPRVVTAVTDAIGPDLQAQFRPWLQHIANEWAADREANSEAEKMMKSLRTNATMVGLGFRFSTILLQVSGYANSIERVGLTAVARGLMKSRFSPEAWSFALDNSKELRSRMATMDRDIRDNARKLASKQAGVLDAAQQFAFHGIGYMDRLVTVATWHGAYDKALAEGVSHDDAVFYADKIVRQSQGSGAAKDMARVQRGTGKMGEAWKLASMFYSYSSAFYQRQAAFVNDTQDAVRERDLSALPDLAARFLWLNIVPALAGAFLAGNGPDDDEDEAAWVLAQILKGQFQGIPIARDIAGALESGFGYSFTPAEGFGRSVVNLYNDGANVVEGKETKRMTRNFLEAVGYTTGKVPGQLATSTQFLVDVGYGDQDPETAAEWWRGITKGKTEKK